MAVTSPKPLKVVCNLFVSDDILKHAFFHFMPQLWKLRFTESGNILIGAACTHQSLMQFMSIEEENLKQNLNSNKRKTPVVVLVTVPVEFVDVDAVAEIMGTISQVNNNVVHITMKILATKGLAVLMTSLVTLQLHVCLMHLEEADQDLPLCQLASSACSTCQKHGLT